jgi:hypothetical protein
MLCQTCISTDLVLGSASMEGRYTLEKSKPGKGQPEARQELDIFEWE